MDTAGTQNPPPGGTVIEATPANQNPQQQQNTIGGNPSPPNNSNMQGTTLAPPSSLPTHGLTFQLDKQINNASSASYDSAFKRQKEVFTNYDKKKASAWLDGECNAFTDTFVYAVLQSGSNKVDLVYGLGKYTDEDPGNTIGDNVLGFMGERDEFGNTPNMFSFPKVKAAEGVIVRSDFSETEFKAFYGIEGNKDLFRPTPGRSATNVEEKVLPTVIKLPLNVGKLAVENDGISLHELYVGIEKLEGDSTCLVTTQHTAFIKQWIIGAAQEVSVTKHSDSAVHLKCQIIVSRTPEFHRFREAKADHYLGKMSSAPTVAAGPSPGHQRLAADLEFMKQQAEVNMSTMAAVAKALQFQNDNNNNNHQTTGRQAATPNSVNPTLGSKGLTSSIKAQVMGYSHVSNECDMTRVWTETYYTGKSNDSKRDDILDGIMDWSDKITRLQVHTGFHLDEKFLTDVEGGDIGMGEPRACTETLERGLSAQQFLPVSLQYKTKAKDKEKAVAATSHTRTLQEQLQLNSSMARPPPTTLSALRLGTNTYTGGVYVHFGPDCPLYIHLLSLCMQLKSETVECIEAQYDALLCMQIWFTILDKSRIFFSSRVKERDFNSVADPPFPECTLSVIMPNVESGQAIVNLLFPRKWTLATGPTQQQRLPPSGLPPSFPPAYKPQADDKPRGPFLQQPQQQQSVQDSVAHVHPTIKKKLKAFHNQFEGRIDMATILQAGNIVFDDLPLHPTTKERICWQHILGQCRFQNGDCHFYHVPANEIEDQFATEVCRVIEPGVGQLLANPPQYGHLVQRWSRKRPGQDAAGGGYGSKYQRPRGY